MGLYPNSVAFTDSCIGNFIDKLKELPVWKNTLVIFVSDHGYPYQKDVVNYEPRRYHIPMLWIGGAVKEPVVIDKLANQTDLAATLLNQLGIDQRFVPFVVIDGYTGAVDKPESVRISIECIFRIIGT